MSHLIRLFCFYLVVSSAGALANDLSVFTHGNKGKVYYSESGEMRGIPHSGRRAFLVELVREILFLSEQRHHKMQNVPFGRGWQMLTNGKNTALFNLARTEKREKLVNWIGPLQVSRISFYQAANSSLQLHQLEQAKNVAAICVLNASYHQEYFQQRGFSNLVANISYENCLSMLDKGRVDLVVIADTGLNESLKIAGLSPSAIKKSLHLYTKASYLALSKDIPESRLVGMRKALTRIKTSGKYKQLLEQYYLPTAQTASCSTDCL